MQDTLKLGRLVGVKVGANWSLFALAAIVAYFLATSRLPADAFGYTDSGYWLAGALTAVALLAGVLVHEVAHAVAAQRAGLHVDGITLWFMGGVTRIDGDNRKPSTELVVALVGPLASGVIGALSLLLAWPTQNAGWSLTAASLRWLGLINLLLGVFNLLPASPLDGGRVLHGLIWSVTKNRWLATRLAAGAGMVLGAACGLLGLLAFDESDALDGVVLLVMGWFVISSSKREQLAGRAQHVLGDAQVSDIMRPAVLAPGWLTVSAFWNEWVNRYPDSAFLLESWGGDTWKGVVTAQQLAGVPPSMQGSCESPGRRPSPSSLRRREAKPLWARTSPLWLWPAGQVPRCRSSPMAPRSASSWPPTSPPWWPGARRSPSGPGPHCAHPLQRPRVTPERACGT